MPKIDPDRIWESDLLLSTLKYLAAERDGYLPTSSLRGKLLKAWEPQGEDAVILPHRNDSRFTQIVRNMISHKSSPKNIVGLGYAEHVNRGLRITPKGHVFLAEMTGKALIL